MPTDSESPQSAHQMTKSFWPPPTPPPYVNLLEQEDLQALEALHAHNNSREYILSRPPITYPSQARHRLQILEEIKESGLSEFPSRLIKHFFNEEPTLTLIQWIKDNNLDMQVVRADGENYFENWIRFTFKEQLDDSML